MKTVLVLEDETSLMELLRQSLKQYKLIEASTAEQALRLFIENGSQVDLLVSDVTLPKISGIQVALLLRSKIPDLPVLLTSGYPVSDWSSRDFTDLQRLGSASVTLLSKPFRIHDLLSRVRELTGGHADRNCENGLIEGAGYSAVPTR